MTTLPTDSEARKSIPLARGVLDYFPAALAEVARLSLAGNDKHNPNEEMHHARGKSTDHADCIMRHLAERDTIDDDGFLHDVKVAWRALAMLQEAMERRGAPLARGARLPIEEAIEKKDEQYQSFVVPSLSTRIAGETPSARDIKNRYYKFDPSSARGWCQNRPCYTEIKHGQPALVDSAGRMYCSVVCRDESLCCGAK